MGRYANLLAGLAVGLIVLIGLLALTELTILFFRYKSRRLLDSKHRAVAEQEAAAAARALRQAQRLKSRERSRALRGKMNQPAKRKEAHHDSTR